MTKTRWIAIVVVAVVVSASAAVTCRPDSDQAAIKSSNIHEFSVFMPFLGNRPIPKVNDLFGKVKAGQTIVLRFKVSNFSPCTGIGASDIHVEKGKVVFYSEEGEYQFVPGPGGTTEVNVRFNKGPREKMFHFRDGHPYFDIMVSYNYNKEEAVHANIVLDGVIHEDLSKEFDYRQSIECRGLVGDRASVELKVQLSRDYSGRIGGWNVFRGL